MGQTNNSFKLRVKTTPGAGTPDPAPKEIVVYHWGRIFGALVAVILLVAGLVWLVWPTSATNETSVLGASQESKTAPEKADAGTTPPSAPATDTTPLQGESSTDKQAVDDGDRPLISGEDQQAGMTSESSQETLSAVPPSAATADESSSGINSTGNNDETSGADNASAISATPEKALAPEPQPAAQPADNAQKASETTQASQTTPDTSAAAEPEAVSNNNPDKAEVTLQSDHLKRAVLSRTLHDKEPGAALPANVSMNKDGIIRVYFFNELDNLKGKTVFHDWYRDDKRVARVTIRPYSDDQRASSAKYINRNMLGQWRVKAVTKGGDLLGSGHFTVEGRGEAE